MSLPRKAASDIKSPEEAVDKVNKGPGGSGAYDNEHYPLVLGATRISENSAGSKAGEVLDMVLNGPQSRQTRIASNDKKARNT